MNSAARLILGCSLLAVALPAAAAQAAVPAPAAAQSSAHERLFQLFKESDEAYLQRNPLQALYRGDYRYADRLGDLYSDAHFQGEKAAAEHDLAALATIPRGELNADDQLAYDVFACQTKDTLRSLQPDLLPLSEVLPMNHFYGLHTQYATISSGQGGAPFQSVADYENALGRNRDFATNVDQVRSASAAIAGPSAQSSVASMSGCRTRVNGPSTSRRDGGFTVST